ncbi:MAG: OprD family outer membrane porin, partial [Enhydrobacter sp.]
MALIAPGPSARGEDIGELVRKGFYDEASLTVHLRSYYLDRTNPRLPNNVAWAGGGWLGYQTGWFADVLRFGVVGYTSQPLSAPPGTDGTLLLRPGQLGYTALGQAYGQLKLWDQVFTGYRQLINQPEVNPHDNRMTPNTFEAYLLSGKLGDVSYLAGFVDRMKPRNSEEFIDMATVAGAPAGSKEGMILAGLAFAPDETAKMRASGYFVPNVLASGYGDFSKTFSVTDDIDLRVGGQFMVQGSTGINLLTTRPFSTWAGGLDLDFIWG